MHIIAYLICGKIIIIGKSQYLALPDFGRGQNIGEAKI
jgi:hypothetical protein